VKKAETKGEAGKEVEQRPTALELQPRIQTLNRGRAAYGEILIFMWGRLLRAKFL
jgi:hypothetical protein